MAAAVLLAGSAFGQASRTWVSGVGDDANPCSRTAPCKTFPGAISKTAVCGEIDALDPAGFGVVTITKSITIDGGGFLASILASGTNGVVVQIAPDTCGQTVILRNLSINGFNTGLNGIRLLGGTVTNLHVEHVSIARFSQKGIDVSPTVSGDKVFLRDLDIRATTGDGIDFSPSAAAATKISAFDVRVRQSAAAGLHFTNDTSGTIVGSQFQGNNNGVQIDTASCHIGLVDTTISENSSNGLQLGTGTVFIDHLSAMRNGTGVLNNGTVNSFGNSAIANNIVADVTNPIVTLPHP